MRFLSILFVSAFMVIGVVLTGCADRPEVGPTAYGTVINQLPSLKEAEEPFKFPYAGDTDHSKCKFNEEDFF